MALHPNLAAIESTLAIAESVIIRDFLQYMQEIHPADRLPPRAAFDPMRIAHLLGNVVLVEVERQHDGALRFLVRVAGEMVLRAIPVPMMNRYLDSTVGLTPESTMPSRAIIIDIRRQVVETGVTQYKRGKPTIPFRFDFADVELVHCPLAEDGRTVDRVLSAFHYYGAPES